MLKSEHKASRIYVINALKSEGENPANQTNRVMTEN